MPARLKRDMECCRLNGLMGKLWKSCFGYAMATLKGERRVKHLFDGDGQEQQGENYP